MKVKPPIRIIKREQRELHSENSAAKSKETPKDFTREVTATISTWVSEYQQRRRTNTTHAFASLFKEQVPHLDALS